LQMYHFKTDATLSLCAVALPASIPSCGLTYPVFGVRPRDLLSDSKESANPSIISVPTDHSRMLNVTAYKRRANDKTVARTGTGCRLAERSPREYSVLYVACSKIQRLITDIYRPSTNMTLKSTRHGSRMKVESTEKAINSNSAAREDRVHLQIDAK